MKEKLPENKPFSAKNANKKRPEKGILCDVIFINCGHLKPNGNYPKKFTCISVQKPPEELQQN